MVSEKEVWEHGKMEELKTWDMGEARSLGAGLARAQPPMSTCIRGEALTRTIAISLVRQNELNTGRMGHCIKTINRC